jgi:hypothetical protein
LITPIPEDLDINSNKKLQEEEIYPFLVKKCQQEFRKNRTTTFTFPEAIQELFSDDNVSDDDGVREAEDSAVNEDVYSSLSESDDDCPVDFGAPEIEIDQNNSMHYEKESEHQYSWIVIWILKYKERYWLSNVATEFLFKFFRYVLININESLFSDFPIWHERNLEYVFT